MTYVKTYLPTLKTHVVNLKRDPKDLSRDLQQLEVGDKLESKTLYYLCSCRTWYTIGASPSFLMPSSQQEQLTFGSLTDEIFVFLATFREFPAIFQDFDAFIFIQTS